MDKWTSATLASRFFANPTCIYADPTYQRQHLTTHFPTRLSPSRTLTCTHIQDAAVADSGKNNGEIVSPPSPQRSPLSPQAQGERGTQYEQEQQHELKVGDLTRSPSSRCSFTNPI